MADNFRIKYNFQGREYTSGVSDVFRNKTEYHIFFPLELRTGEAKVPQFLVVTRQDSNYISADRTPLSSAMFNGFVLYMSKRPM